MERRDQLVKFSRGTLHNSDTFSHRHIMTCNLVPFPYLTKMNPTTLTVSESKLLKTEISKFLVDEGGTLGTVNKEY